MEMMFAVAVFALAAAGLGLGLMLGRGAPRACAGESCAVEGGCAACPRRRRAAEAET